MKTRVIAILSLAALVFLGACELNLGREAEGTLTFYFGTGSSARAYSDAPFAGLPVFSSVTVTVSGTGMTTASRTVSGTAGRVTLQVPAGASRRVEVYAVPDWTATQLQQGSTPLPTLAKAYGGTAVVDVAGGETVNVSMEMSVVETKIVLPGSGETSFADTLAGPGSPAIISPAIDQSSDIEFDRYGRLFVSNWDGIDIFPNLDQGPDYVNVAVGNSRMAYDRRNERMYFLYNSDGVELRYLDLAENYEEYVNNTLNLMIYGGGIAADKDGYIYVQGNYMTPSENWIDVIAKLRIVFNGETMETQLAGYATLDSLGLGYWVTSGETYFVNLEIQDMRIQDGVLYIAAGEHGGYDPLHHGKIVAARVSDMTKFREIGWSPTTPIPNPSTQFYGPMRFLAIVPRKLVIADEGYDGTEINRVVEVDLDSWNISGIGLSDTNFPFLYLC